MRLMQNLICIIVALMIAGCATEATEAGYEETLNGWIGSSEARLISSWGVPDRVYEAGGKTYLTYQHSSQRTLAGTQPSYRSTVYGNTTYTRSYGGTYPETINYSCKTTFTVDKRGLIVGSSGYGDCEQLCCLN